MNPGKDICKELKAVRRRIAEENDIPLQQEECHYEGECDGTCPHCEAELQYIENELSRRISKGNIVKVAGLALGLAACSSTQPQVVPRPLDNDRPLMGKPAVKVDIVEVKGQVVDGRNQEPLPFVQVLFLQGERTLDTVTTDMNGLFSARLPRGEYAIRVQSVGYEPKVVNVMATPSDGIETIMLNPIYVAPQLMGMPPLREVPIEIGPDAPSQQMEMEGVKVKVQ